MGIPSYGVDYEGQYDFLQIGTITFAEAALGVDERDNASVEDLAVAKKVIWRPDQGTAAAILRFRTDGSEDDAPVIEMYGAKGADYYTRIGTLTLAQGTQDWSGGHFVDEITLSNEKWSHGIRADSVTDEIGRVVFNTGGFDRFLFIASTLAVTTIHIDIARLDKQIDQGIEIHSAILVLADNMTVSDVVSAISDMHSDLAAANDGLSAQFSSIITELEGIETTLNAISGHTDSTLDYISSLVTGVETVETTLNTISGAIDSTLDYTSSLVTGVETVNTNLVAVKSAISDGLSAQFSSIITELEGIETTLNAISGHTDSTLDYISSLVTGVETVETTLNTISGAIDSTLDYTSSLVTGVETVNTNLVAVKSAISDGLSAQFSSIITELEGIETTLNAISGHTDSTLDYISSLVTGVETVETTLNTISGAIDSTLDYTSSLVTGVETVNTNLGTLENDVVSVHSAALRTELAVDSVASVLLRGLVSAGTPSVLLLSDIASAADGTRLEVSNAISNLKDAVNLTTTEVSDAISHLESTLSDAISIQIANDDLIEAGLRSGFESALSAIDESDSVHSALSGIVITAIDAVTTAVGLVEGEVKSAADSIMTNLDLNESGIRSGVKSAIIVNEVGIRSGVKSALIVTDAAVAAADATSAVLAMDSALSGAFVTLESTLDNLVAVPIEKTPVLVTQFVAVSGTAEALIGSETFVRAIYLQARKVAGDNTGNIFIGLSDLDQGVAELFEVIPGGTYELVMPAGCKVDLNDIYVDADNADDGVVGYYIPV